MGRDDKDKPEIHDREHVGITGGAGATFVGIDAKHLDVDALSGRPSDCAVSTDLRLDLARGGAAVTPNCHLSAAWPRRYNAGVGANAKARWQA